MTQAVPDISSGEDVKREVQLQPARRRAGLVAMFVSTFLALSGVFMFGPLLLITLKQQGVDTVWVALFSAAQWVGMGLATPYTGRAVRRLGLRRALLLSSSVPLITMLIITLTHQVWLWGLAALLGGSAASLRWIVSESTVAELASAHSRGRTVGLFESMIGGTFVLGPALLALIGTEGPAAQTVRWTAIGLGLLGLLTTLTLPTLQTHLGDSARLGWRGIWDAVRAAPLVMTAGFVGGFFEAGIAGVLPLYGLTIGLSAALSALLVSASGLGSSLVMMPAGAMADRWPLRRVLQGCALVNLIGCLMLPWVSSMGALAWVIAFAWGGAGGALYTLAMIDIGHRHQGVTLVNATAVLVLAYTCGGALAPTVAGVALQWQPAWGFPLALTLVGLLGLVAAVHTRS